MKVTYFKKLFTLILAFSCYLIAFSATATLAVGGIFRCDATSAVQGLTTDVSWSTNGGYFSLTGSGFYRDVQVSQYFSGEATITCQWKYRLYAGDQYRTQKVEWTISCVDNRISITPTNMSLHKGEVKKITAELSYNTKGTPTIYYVSDNPQVASVSSDGFVKAISKGNTVISVTSDYGSNTVCCSVEVDGGGSDSGDNNNSSDTRTIHVDKAGTLKTLISDSDVYSITSLTLSGCLNGSDLRILRRMTGMDENNITTKGKLRKLDLTDAVFVKGGAWYLNAHSSYSYTDDFSCFPERLFAWSPKLESINLPRTISTIGYWSLHWLNNLKNIEFPVGVTRIYENLSFCGSLKNITLPSTLKSIDCDFYDSDNLTTIYCYAPEPPKAEKINKFSNASVITLYVPKGTSDKYWAIKPWNTVGDIVEMDQEPTYPMNFRLETMNGEILVKGEKLKKQYDNVLYSGYYCLDLKKDETVVLDLIPNTGYVVESVVYNGNDLTDKIVDGKINITNTNSLDYNTVRVKFKETPTGIGQLEDSQLNVFKEGNRIIIENSNRNDLIEIYNIAGTKIKSMFSSGCIMSIPVDNKFYLVKIGHKTFKVL